MKCIMHACSWLNNTGPSELAVLSLHIFIFCCSISLLFLKACKGVPFMWEKRKIIFKRAVVENVAECKNFSRGELKIPPFSKMSLFCNS